LARKNEVRYNEVWRSAQKYDFKRRPVHSAETVLTAPNDALSETFTVLLLFE